jgi:hypothetical protein
MGETRRSEGQTILPHAGVGERERKKGEKNVSLLTLEFGPTGTQTQSMVGYITTYLNNIEPSMSWI